MSNTSKITTETITITDISDPRVAIYADMNENRLKRIYEPAEGLFICESKKVIERAISAGYEVESFFVVEEMVGVVSEIISDSVVGANTCTISNKKSEFPDEAVIGDDYLPLYVSKEETMKKITGYSLTGGMLAAMRRKPIKDIEHVIKNVNNVVILDDIENPTNVGAIFRSAAALGADAVLLTKGCADPLYRRAIRVSMGTVFAVDWTFVSDKTEEGKTFIETLKQHGFTTMALALSDVAKDITDPELKTYTNTALDCNTPDRKALIFGNEDHGISDEILAECDYIVKIPMYAGVDSLNVAAASAVACWELFRKER